MDVSVFSNPDHNPFTQMDNDRILNIDNFILNNTGSAFERWTLNFDDGTVDMKKHIDCVNVGGCDFPNVNKNYDMVKDHRYTYLINSGTSTQKLDPNYCWPIAKFDHKTGSVAAMWAPPLVLTNEPRFVPKPGGEEDEGVIMLIGFRILKNTWSMFVIDSKTMTTLQEYPLAHGISITAHNTFWSDMDKSISLEEEELAAMNYFLQQ